MRLDLYRFRFILIGLLFFSFCPLSFAAQKQISLPFNAVTIVGSISVQITEGCPKSQIQFTTDRNTLKTIRYSSTNGVLYLKRIICPKLGVCPIQVKIMVPNLTQLNVNGGANVRACNLCGPLSVSINGNSTSVLDGNNIDLRDLRIIGPAVFSIKGVQSSGLNIYHIGSGNLTLEGQANLNRFTQIGGGKTDLSWINSKKVVLEIGGGGRVFMAGRVCVLEATLHDLAFLDAKNLHALRGYIQTNEKSYAEIWVCNSLTAWATGCSTIYYYTDPLFAARYMCPPATILRMNGITSCQCCLK